MYLEPLTFKHFGHSQIYDTFQETGIATGLTQNNCVWEDTPHEDMVLSKPSQLRNTTYLLLFFDVLNPQKLWDSF